MWEERRREGERERANSCSAMDMNVSSLPLLIVRENQEEIRGCFS